MNPAKKQRLVGALVLGSLAAILIPLLLDGEGVERAPLPTLVPPAPVFDTTPLPDPERPEILADSFAPDTTAVPAEVELTDSATESSPELAVETSDTAAEDTTEAEAPDVSPEPAPAPATVATTPPAEEPAAPPAQSVSEPALDASGLPEGWTVRLGVFGNSTNANRLQSRLAADGFKAYVRPLGVSTAVFVGPVLTQDEATALQSELNGLKAKYQIDNVIVQRYDVGQ